MSKTNSLTSHHGERNTHRADKMSGGLGKEWVGYYKKFFKKFASKKRRALLRNINNDKI